MNIGIVDADLLDNGTRHPNLALMKISGYYKELGHTVELLFNYDSISEYDKVFLSCVFDFTKIPIKFEDYPNLQVGGSGLFWDKAESLPHEIEHHMPDYHLYDEWVEKEISRGIKPSQFNDYMNYSIGFATRGCVRKCSFCINHNKTKVEVHSPIEEFFDPSRKAIYLWDDNFLAYPKWKEILQTLIDTGKYFQFRQGLDLRLINDEKAEMLSRCKYKGAYIFAFDNIADKEIIIQKLKLWKKYVKKETELYVFCGFDRNDKYDNEFWKQDIIDTFERIYILMKNGCTPYIMRHENYKESPYRGMYINLARWCNQPSFYKKKSFRDFCITNGEKSSCYKYMKDFEKEYQDIATNYYDMRYEDLNIYIKIK